MTLKTALIGAFEYVSMQGVEVPREIWVKTAVSGAIKADGDLGSINAAYHDAITAALTTYLEGGNATAPKNSFKRAMVEAFGGAWDLGLNGTEADEDALSWFNARVELELTNIDSLFIQAKELRKQEDFEPFDWVTARADGYVNSLREVYNNAHLRAMDNMMVTFDGDDGAESCPDCQKLKGKRHKISWFIAHDYVPPFGHGLECHPGGRCQHGLMDDKGKWVTV